MSMLELPNVDLYYETMGDGPLLVLIPGANGDTSVFGPVSERLAQQFTVVTYDRRGYSRSEISGTGEDDDRLATDANDVRRLIEHLTDERAFVFGTSSGAIVALEVLINHPSRVDTLIAHEPPLMNILPNADWWTELVTEVYETYEEVGMGPAMEIFANRMVTESDGAIMTQRRDPNQVDETVLQNSKQWFEVEFKAVARYEPAMDVLAEQAERLVLANGRASADTPPHQATAFLAEQLGLDVLPMPDGHLGYATQPEAFAQELVDGLTQRDAL